MTTARDLEQVLVMLTMPDNRMIQQATLQLKTAFTDPNVVGTLIDVLKVSSNPTVRQYASILLRKRIVKQWNKLNVDVQYSLKNSLVQCLSTESEHLVRNAICQVISSIARHKFKEEGWPEVMLFIANAVQSADIKEKEIGYTLLHCICAACGELLKPYYHDLFPMFEKGMNEQCSRKAAFYSIKALTSIVPTLGTDEEGLIKLLIPKALEIVKVLLLEDEDKACEALELFDELVEVEVGIVIPYVKALVELCLQIVQCYDYGDAIRVKALYLLCWACRRKAKALLKSHLLQPLLETLLSLMSLVENSDPEDAGNSSQGNDDDDEEDLGEMEGSTLPSVAAQALDLLALHLPPAKFIPQVMSMIQKHLGSSNHYQRKAGFIALGVLAEGCADYIKNRHLREALQTVSKGFTDESYVVRNAALFTLGQFAEHFQQDMNVFHGEIIPALLLQMQNTLVTQDLKQKTTLTRLFYALESLCENLDKSEISVYLQSLVETFLNTIKASKGLYATELAISAIGSLATSAKEELLPYFPHIMDHLKMFIQEPATLETSSLQAQAIDTLGSLARNIGEKNFKILADECMQLGMMLLEDSDDPDIRRCTYGLFASLSTIMKRDMERYLSRIIPKMIESLKSFEGFMSQYNESEPAFLLDDDLGDSDVTGDDEDDEVEGYTVENAYLDEKEDTCNAIGEIAEQTREAFLPYIEECFNEVQLFVDDPNVNLRKAAIMSCASLSAVLKSVLKQMGTVDQTQANILTSKAFSFGLSLLNKDHDQSCVMAAVDAVNEILKSFSGGELQNKEIIHQIATSAHNLFLEKTPCQQDGDDSFQEEDEESQAEMDAMLIEKAGDILPLLAQAVGGAVFKPYFDGFLPLLTKRTRKNCAVSEKSFAVGTLAEVIQAMELTIVPYVDQLLQIFLITLNDQDEEVISNSVFAIGVLAECGKEAVIKYYSNILETLFSVVNRKSSNLVMDNICGAVSRMMMTSVSDIPLAQVLPVLIHHLPIKEDKSENETVMKCFCFLYTNIYSAIEQYVGQILGHLVQSVIAADSGLKPETRNSVRHILQDIKCRFPSDFEGVMTSMGINDTALEYI